MAHYLACGRYHCFTHKLRHRNGERWTISFTTLADGKRHELTLWANRLPELHLALRGQGVSLRDVEGGQVDLDIALTQKGDGVFNEIKLINRPKHLHDAAEFRRTVAANRFIAFAEAATEPLEVWLLTEDDIAPPPASGEEIK